MSASLRCDGCGEMIDGIRVATPRMTAYDLRPDNRRATGFAIGGHAEIPDPVSSDKENLAKLRRGFAGYPIKHRSERAHRDLVSMWVTWRPEEDQCAKCVEMAICKAAEKIMARRA